MQKIKVLVNMVMKNRFIYLILVFVLILTSCSSVKQSDVSLTLENSVLPVGTKSIVIKWNNNTDSTILFGEEFGIEQKENGEWVRLHYSDNYVFDDVGITLLPMSEKEQCYDLIAFFGKDLPEGEYRIRANYSFDDGKDYTEKDYYVVYAEFTLK